jgi:hypothetical protein
MSQVMGFEGKAWVNGTPGADASVGGTLLENSRDISYSVDTEMGDTTVRGDSSAPPIGTEEVTKRVLAITIQMINDTSDTIFATMMAAAFNSSRVALRLKDRASGKGFDGDVTLTASNPYPLNGEQVIDFTAKPSRASRAPQGYV